MMKRVYLFEEGRADMRDLLGGKGANLAEMTTIGLPVPPGFTITTDVCRDYMRRGRLPDDLMDEVRDKLKVVEQRVGKRFGDPQNPLLVSVRSGAKFSMPGMMDTILNLGLNDETAQGMIRLTKNPRFVYDAYRRFIMSVRRCGDGCAQKAVRGALQRIEGTTGRHAGYRSARRRAPVAGGGVQADCAGAWQGVPPRPVGAAGDGDRGGVPLHGTTNGQWSIASGEKIPHDLGTACNVQAMVFGNMGDDSGTGVAFRATPPQGRRCFMASSYRTRRARMWWQAFARPCH
jgi:pyruvate,orthophosphate dikinase